MATWSGSLPTLPINPTERIIAEATEGLGGPIEILVNNAAAAIYQPMADYPARRIRLTMAVNVEAPFALMRGSSQR